MSSQEKKSQPIMEFVCTKVAEIIVADIVSSLENNQKQVETILEFFKGPKGDSATQYFINKYFGLMGNTPRDARVAIAANNMDVDAVELKKQIIVSLKKFCDSAKKQTV